MVKVTLTAQKRTLVGRKVKQLRREGVLPANIYGKKADSLAVQLPLKELENVYEKVGETGVVEVKINGEVRPALVVNVQLHPVTDTPLHVDFRQVDLREKITASVPIELSGEAPAQKSGAGILVQHMNEVEVEALPTDLPENLVADISGLSNVDDAVKVADLVVDREKVTILTEEEQIVAKIEPLAAEEVAPPPVEEAAAEEGVEAPAAEGEEAPAAEAPAEEETEEKKEE